MDQPTAHLDPSRPANACLRCGTPMIAAEVSADFTRPIVLLRRAGGPHWWQGRNGNTQCQALMCPEGGYTKLRAENPKALPLA
jgi:hypothetical protein